MYEGVVLLHFFIIFLLLWIQALEWVNQSLTSAGYLGDVEDVVKDLTDGVHLPDLIHSLGKSVRNQSILEIQCLYLNIKWVA